MIKLVVDLVVVVAVVDSAVLLLYLEFKSSVITENAATAISKAIMNNVLLGRCCGVPIVVIVIVWQLSQASLS